MLSDADVEDHFDPSLRLIEVDRRGSPSCGFNLTRGKWDPYPWVSSVLQDTAAFAAGLKPGDCLLEVNGEDVVGRRVSEIAEMVKSKPDQVSLLLWNAGVHPLCTPEAICCGPMPTNLQRLSACMSAILSFLECPVCLDTIPPPTYQCDNGHLICIRCRTKSERCPVCRLRLTRGRSLLSDQIYNSLTDAFDLKEGDGKIVKMHQILNTKGKKKNVPDIKITQTQTNKFLSRIVSKASSVNDINTTSTCDPILKTKSLSTTEIFQSETPFGSRSNSITRLSRKHKNFLTPDRSFSYHGSLDSLHKRLDDINCDNTALCHCPFKTDCPTLIKGTKIIDHFRSTHDGPLIQFFKPRLKISLKKLLKRPELCYMLHLDSNVFFVRIEQIEDETHLKGTLLLWTWFLGDKSSAKDFVMQVAVRNVMREEMILSVQHSVCSMNATSYLDIRDLRKGLFLNTSTLESTNISKDDVVVDIDVSRVDAE